MGEVSIYQVTGLVDTPFGLEPMDHWAGLEMGVRVCETPESYAE